MGNKCVAIAYYATAFEGEPKTLAIEVSNLSVEELWNVALDSRSKFPFAHLLKVEIIPCV